MLTIRTATLADLDALDELEQLCFPPAEAASRETLQKRLSVFPQHFWLGFLSADDGSVSGRTDGNARLVSFVNGMVTRQCDLTDDLFTDTSLHDEHGDWQMIFGVDTHPAFQRRGFAAEVLRRAISDAREQGRKGVVLTCKEKLLHWYARFGFVNEGISVSEHGGAEWYQMRIRF